MECETKTVTLAELVSAMSHLPDDAVFRWFQDSAVIPSKGWHQATVTYRVTLGRVRKELGLSPNGG